MSLTGMWGVFATLTFFLMAHLSCFSTLAKEPAESAEKITPLLPGLQVPDVTFLEIDGKPLKLSSVLREGPVILIFYRGGW